MYKEKVTLCLNELFIMRRFLFILTFFLLSFSYIPSAKTQIKELMEKYLWEKRILIIFTPDLKNESYKTQNLFLEKDKKGLKERHLVIWEIIEESFVRRNKSAIPYLPASLFYKYYKTQKNKFSVILIGKDGTEKLRQAKPISSAKLFSIIDAMPMRQKEIQQTKDK